MVQSVKATYKDGVLEPSESLDLEDGDVVTLSVLLVESVANGEVTNSTSVGANGKADTADSEGESGTGAAKEEHSVLRMIREIHESIPDSAWDNVPTDGSINYKHYLYGHPKVDDS